MASTLTLLAAVVLAAPAPAPRPPEVDLQLRRLCEVLAGQLRTKDDEKKLAGPLYTLRIGVLGFVEDSDDARQGHVGPMLTDSLLTCLSSGQGLNVVEYERRDVLWREQQIRRVLGDRLAARTVESSTRVDLLAVGRISDAGPRFRISARVVDVSTGVVHATDTVSVEKEPLIDWIADILPPRRIEAAFRSVIPLSGWGQFYNDEYGKALISIGAQVGLFGGATGFFIAGWREEERYGHNQRATVGRRDTAKDYYRTGEILAALGAAVWLYGIIDAFLDGYTYDRRRAHRLSVGESRGESVGAEGDSPAAGRGSRGAPPSALRWEF